jgi:hypothetical protein
MTDQGMSDPEATVPGSADDRQSRVRSVRAVIWFYLRRRRGSGAETKQTFQVKDRSNIDELADEVFGLFQAVPDDCENPQAVLIELARAAELRRDGEGGVNAERGELTPEVPCISGVSLAQRAFGALNPEAQKLILMQLSSGNHYRSIAELLNMQPAHVLRTIREAYVQMRWHTEPLDQADGGPAKPGF